MDQGVLLHLLSEAFEDEMLHLINGVEAPNAIV